MKERVIAKGVEADRIAVVPPWSHDDRVNYSESGREVFRQKHGLSDRFVVMYSGNHSPCHPLDTLLEAALALRARSDLVFCFVGGGSEQIKVREFAARHTLNNVKCLSYQPLNGLSSSLSAADLHVVVMGEEFVGIVHPCKVYNVMSVGAPVLYIGPQPSHLSEILDGANGSIPHGTAAHGDVDEVVRQIRRLKAEREQERRAPTHGASQPFAKQTLMTK